MISEENYSESFEHIRIANECAKILKIDIFDSKNSFTSFLSLICDEAKVQKRQDLLEILHFAGIIY